MSDARSNVVAIKDRASDVAKTMREQAVELSEDCGDDIASFALVAVDKRGRIHSVFNVGHSRMAELIGASRVIERRMLESLCDE